MADDRRAGHPQLRPATVLGFTKAVPEVPPSPTLSLRSYRPEPDAHRHAYHQFVLPLEGGLEMELEGQSALLAPGRGVCVAAEERHAFFGVGENRFVVVDLGTAWRPLLTERLWESARHAPFFSLDGGLTHQVRYAATRLCGPRGRPWLADTVADSWAALLVQHLLEAGGAPPAKDPRLERAIAYLRANWARGITVADVAKAAGMSVSHLHSRFSAAYGMTPFAYLRDLRLDRAVEHLRASDASVAHIAHRCGFADQSSLTRAMRRRRDTTPAEVRRHARARPTSE